MTRVSENSGTDALNFTLNKVKSKVEDLQLKGATLKKINKPSDNPLGNIQYLGIQSRDEFNEQYLRNANKAVARLNAAEDSLTQIGEIISRAKELALYQASDTYGPKERSNVAAEIRELRNQALAFANKREGVRYIFGGYNSLKPPFSSDGKYHGDNNYLTLEVAKDFFVPIALPGNEIFFTSNKIEQLSRDPIREFEEVNQTVEQGRYLASVNKMQEGFSTGNGIFANLDALANALENNEGDTIRSLLERFDDNLDRVITMRTKIGALNQNISAATENIGLEKVNNADIKSKLVDEDIAELFSDLTKQNNVLKTAYQSGKVALSQNLLDFLR
jgi:flagellar hook-associated protein 3 FlgL